MSCISSSHLKQNIEKKVTIQYLHNFNTKRIDKLLASAWIKPKWMIQRKNAQKQWQYLKTRHKTLVTDGFQMQNKMSRKK